MPDLDLERLRSLTCIKWSYFDGDVLPAWVADMDLPPADVVLDAGRALFDRGDLGYNFAAQAQLPEVFAARQERRFGWKLDHERVRVICDVMQGVEMAVWAHTKPGDGVVLLTPVYHPFYRTIAKAGCRLVDVPLEADGWRLNAERLEAAIDEGTRVLLLCNPHNPAGRTFTREELLAMADVAERHDLLVVSDEIWADLTYTEGEHIPFASLSEDAASRTITITAASKAFNIAGLRTAVMHVGHDGVRAALKAIPQHVFGGVSSPGAEATLAAWTKGDEWLASTVAHLAANRDHLATRLAEELPSVGYRVPEATYVAWLDFRGAGFGDNPAKELLETARVGLSTGTDFGAETGKGFARLNFATTRPILDAIIDRIVAAATRS
ncbi:MAG TPA: PatB family C-S lyase [Coriobacteriia bacterium]|nr:PatB family C-S lyase [Coriobacteriia bacterium]